MRVYLGSILDCPADVIVNPANSFMRHGGGLAAVLDTAATKQRTGYYLRMDGSDGPDAKRFKADQAQIDAYIKHRTIAPLVATGDAILGPPGVLPYKAICHAVGPIWDAKRVNRSAVLLMDAYESALSVSEDAGYESIVFPAIGAGIFGCPIDYVARAAVSMCRLTALDVTFAVMTDEHAFAFLDVIEQHRVANFVWPA